MNAKRLTDILFYLALTAYIVHSLTLVVLAALSPESTLTLAAGLAYVGTVAVLVTAFSTNLHYIRTQRL